MTKYLFETNANGREWKRLRMIEEAVGAETTLSWNAPVSTSVGAVLRLELGPDRSWDGWQRGLGHRGS
jgi:hypothetical protein